MRKVYTCYVKCPQCSSVVTVTGKDRLLFGAKKPIKYAATKCDKCGKLLDTESLDIVKCPGCDKMVHADHTNRCPLCNALLITKR